MRRKCLILAVCLAFAGLAGCNLWNEGPIGSPTQNPPQTAAPGGVE